MPAAIHIARVNKRTKNRKFIENMNNKAIIKACRDIGCCDACCVRYCGLRKPTIFSDFKKFIVENTDTHEPSSPQPEADTNGTPAKRQKTSNVCVSCLGILQEDGWPECLTMTKEVLDKKKYQTSTFACALSAPMATIIREKALVLKLTEMFPAFDSDAVTALKEAWKWSLGPRLATQVCQTLDSGASAPLMITLNMEYVDDSAECEVFSPSPESVRHRQKRQRVNVPVTRCLLDRALDGLTLENLYSTCKWGSAVPLPASAARCVSVEATHVPVYLGGRYIKLSRSLSQSPWVLHGERMMESSVQEIIFKPIADIYELSAEDAEHRLKFLSAGREDVDVRCLGDGRPFAIEISDPRRALTDAELSAACQRISQSGQVIVHRLVPVTKEQLVELKKGEESKYKTYEALCIKLSHTKDDIADGATPETPITVHPRDLLSINTWCDTHSAVQQRTPLRVLHRRSLLVRTRRILALEAREVPGHPSLFTVVVQTEAGTYIKEWVHGELGRTTPALADAIGARTDILALDVKQVLLAWP